MFTDTLPAENGFYWWKLNENDYPTIKRVINSYTFDENLKHELNINFIDGLWSGPLNPPN